ncbi:hypothetical protein AB840_03825 [Megasphaera cerevisiae DSM 20462]|uniref:Uncharacterized protein n=1 Tax=Megasphaera cerevisiae DSM 20462 TaxID=1122219 RepID=A0A0J6WY58_9FIRM|nr:hypothetical protein [Megasphaera cerevisiae]KMO87173.1 hypothetical protein AB840_03825 [Megasphaera cerevisiae DSM 20462]SJZ59617.1 hypothetical protein SAMN05660900_00893 [Megasphaera cerevisiae DSM 20462]
MQPVFDLFTAEDLFNEIKITFYKYKKEHNKDMCKLLFMIMGLNHLREWIAPGFHARNNAKGTTDAEKFYVDIYDNTDEDTNTSNFKIINELCNHSKHFNTLNKKTSCKYETMDEWDDMDSIINFDRGSVSKCLVENKDGDMVDIIDIIERAILYYDANWFSKKH